MYFRFIIFLFFQKSVKYDQMCKIIIFVHMLSFLNKFDFFSMISNHITVTRVIYGAVDIKWRSYYEILIILIDYESKNVEYRIISFVRKDWQKAILLTWKWLLYLRLKWLILLFQLSKILILGTPYIQKYKFFKLNKIS